MGEPRFVVRELLISHCTVPTCPEWARWEVSLPEDRDGWRVCSRHKRWAEKRLVGAARPAASGADGATESKP